MSRSTAICATAAVTLCYGFVAVSLWTESEWRPEWDSAIYLLTARSIANGNGYAYQGEPFFLRPPGFPFLLAWLNGPDGFDFAVLNRFITVSAAASLAAIAFALVPMLGRGWALVAAVLSTTTPIFVSNLNWVLSDIPFLALFFFALSLLGTPGKGSGWPRAMLGALVLALATFFRTVAILLIPSILILVVLRRKGRARCPFLVAAACVVFLAAPWLLRAQALSSSAERPAEQLLLFDYSTAMFHTDPGDPDSPLLGVSEWKKRVAHNLRELRRDITLTVSGTRRASVSAALLAIALLSLLPRRQRRFSLLAGHAVAYGALLLLYFAYDRRLLLPFIPVVYACVLAGALEGGRALGRCSDTSKHPVSCLLPALVAVGLLARNLVGLPGALDAREFGTGGTTLGRLWQADRTLATWLRLNTPREAVILAGNAPVLSLLAERRVYTTRFQRSLDIAERHLVDFAVFEGNGRTPLERRLAAGASRAWEIDAGFRHSRVYDLGPSSD